MSASSNITGSPNKEAPTCKPAKRSILATCRKPLPATNYMIAIAGGGDVRCSKYATFGTEKLAEYAFEAMENRYACFLANHGLLTCGSNLHDAFSVASEIERLAGLHVGASYFEIQ